MSRLLKTLTVVLLLGATMARGAETLTLWEQEKKEDQDILDKIIKRFETKNSGVTVKRAHFKTEDLRTNYQTAALSPKGGGADMVFAPNDFAGPFAIMGLIHPVGDWIDKARFKPEVLGAIQDETGRVWGLPIAGGNHLMLFGNRGLVPEPPETIEDLIEVAKKVTRPESKVYGFAYNLNEPFFFAPFLGAYGGSLLRDGMPDLNTQAMAQALDLAASFKHTSKIVPGDCDYTCADTLFVEGKAGMIINGDWAVAKYEDKLGKDLFIAPLPRSKQTGNWMAPLTSGKFLLYNSRLTGKRYDLAKAFGNFLLSDEVQAIMIQESQRIPALKSKQLDPKSTVSLVEKTMVHGAPMPMSVKMRAVWDSMRHELQQVMAGKQSGKEAAEKMQKAATSKIKRMGH